MYWLVFYNGFGVPDVEAAFNVYFTLCEYAETIIHSCHFDHYTVLHSDFGSMPLKNFIEKYKEKLS